jgi:hypothetical protein
MKIEIATASYNDRRYGKPYIAKMDFTTAKGEPTWGNWVGAAGEAGLLILDNVEAGDVIMRGQRDTRNMKNSAPDYYILDAELKRTACSKVDAYQSWQLKNKVA